MWPPGWSSSNCVCTSHLPRKENFPGRSSSNCVCTSHLTTNENFPGRSSSNCVCTSHLPTKENFPCPRHDGVCGSRGIAPLILTSALDGDEQSASYPGCSIHKEAVWRLRTRILPNLKLSMRLNSIKYSRDRSSKRRFTRHSTT